jgi:cyclic pyranopterin phosphate synthase
MANIQAFISIPNDIHLNISQLITGASAIEVNSIKGPVFATSIVCGVMGAKKTSEIIPFCHQIPLEKCDISIKPVSLQENQFNGTHSNSNFVNKVLNSNLSLLQIDCKVKTSSKTGVEMEALMGVSATALCIYDMLKALSHDMVITNISLISKSGGKSIYLKSQ